MLEPTSAAPKREEQVLVLAAAGLTDKEIAIRLGISPDTVGTYWRRILAKYQAASRTEVVAKYMEERGKASLDNLQYVNECLKLVNEHMIEHGGMVADAILASIADWVLLVDMDGKIVFSNRALPTGGSLSEVLSAPDLAESLGFARQGRVETTLRTAEGVDYNFTLVPGAGAVSGHVVASGRES